MSNIATLKPAHAAPVCMVDIRQVYGNTAIYPIGDVANAFAAIAGTRTLTANTLKQIERLGYRLFVESGGGEHHQAILRAFIGGRQ